MAINEEQFKLEKQNLNKTNIWIKETIKSLKEDKKDIKDSISKMKKETKGKYNNDLQVLNKNHENINKKLAEYKESKKTPYFSRIDFTEKLRDLEKIYIGKIGLNNVDESEELVVDWRAPIADLYYSGTEGETFYNAPQGRIEGKLSLKRKFIINNGKLKDAFDEGINKVIIKSDKADGENELIDEFLKENLEFSSGSKLKDIVATIQKEQNDIIRCDRGKSIIVQGSAGSGKTTVALHRLAYLLYKYKGTLSGEDILVVAPNTLFLDYISEILPGLGVEKVKQKTFKELSIEFLNLKSNIYSKDEKLAKIMECNDKIKSKFIINTSKIKSSMIYKTMMDRYIKYLEHEGLSSDNIKVSHYTLFDAEEIKRLFIKDLKHLPINKRKDEIKRYFKRKLKEKLEKINSRIDREYYFIIESVKSKIEDSKKRREEIINFYDKRDDKKEKIKEKSLEVIDSYFKNWKYDNIKEIYLSLFKDEEIFDKVTGGSVPKALRDYMIDEIKSNMEKNIVDSDDIAAMLYLNFKIKGEKDQLFKHIVVDEAQDYSPFQMYVLKYMSDNDCFTIVGDVGQSIYYYKGIDNWNKFIKDVYDEDIKYIPLSQSYRSTVEIVNFANKVLEKQNNNIDLGKPVLRHGLEPQIVEYEKELDFVKKVDDIVKKVCEEGKTTVAVIGKNIKQCRDIEKILSNSENQWELIEDSDKKFESNYMILPSYMTKGLEFDCSIIFDCDKENYKDNELDKRLLYVILTRALHMEYIFHNKDISPLIF
ncbi:RNA polymerase recycling motor HelD [Clostridium oceanicum]|uniref:RNA polymerase recycling motor HelD n=1 Tax=Clostridium oceanicum TaxID=1543 RepID=A0ABN1JN75_9CLOT